MEVMKASGAVIERKLSVDGQVREYGCELAWLDSRAAVVRFALPAGSGGFGAGVPIPAGSVSWGYFWARRPYNVYRFIAPGGEAVAHRFDAVTDVRPGREVIEYRDLVLDWWATPDGQLIEEDREEFEALRAAGQLPGRWVEAADEAARQVTSRYRHIIDEVARLERRVVGA